MNSLKAHHVTMEISRQKCDFSSQMSLIKFNFQNNNGNPSSGDLTQSVTFSKWEAK